MRVIDLFSGLGGFSQAFLDREHDVVRYDVDPRFLSVPKTIQMNVLDLSAEDLKDAEVVLASPPCNHFSIASVYRHWVGHEPTPATKEQIALVEHTRDIIRDAHPRYWMIENPRCMMRHVLGRPNKMLFMAAYGKEAKKPTDLWGKLPPIDWLMPQKWEKAPRGSKTGVQGYRNPAEAAKIPYAFSLAVCLACEGNSEQQVIA